MDRIFPVNTLLTLQGRDGTFTIREVVGRGASCVVYRADHSDGTEHLLKEYNPQYLNVHRNDQGKLVPEEHHADRFKSGLLRFQAGYEQQLLIRRLDEAKNKTSNIQAIYDDHGTQYIDMACYRGTTYDKVQEDTLFDLLRRAKAIAQALSAYHRAGFLHLDVKPDNIFSIPDTCELIMMFDFDSVIQKSDIMSSGLSYTESWAAPEQRSAKGRKRICEATDLYAVGKIVFHKIMGRHPYPDEQWSFSTYKYDLSSQIFNGVDSHVFLGLTEFFRKTLCVSVNERYSSAEELISALDPLIELANPKKPVLLSNLPAVKDTFVGRTIELEKIHTRLQNKSVLFLQGVGGIGKSTLAQKYAATYAQDYDTIIFALYTSSFKQMFANDKSVPISNVSKLPAETVDQYGKRKFHQFQSLCNKRVLLVIDNMNTLDDPMLPEVYALQCNLLFTTRTNVAGEYPYIDVGVLSRRQDIEEVFYSNFAVRGKRKDVNAEDKETIAQLIDSVDGHTMAVELLAKQILMSRFSPAQMLEQLRSHGLKNSGKERIRLSKDGEITMRSAFEHIKALFDISCMNEDQMSVLCVLALLPGSGMETEQLYKWCQWDSYETLNQLVQSGWVRQSEEDVVSLHPLIVEVMMPYLIGHEAVCVTFLDSARRFVKAELAQMTPADKFRTAEFMDGVAQRVLRCELASAKAAYFLDIVPQALGGFGYLDNCVEYRTGALKIFKQQYGETHRTVLTEMNSLAALYGSKGDLNNSEHLHKQVLELRIANLGTEDHIDVATSYFNLGQTAFMKQQYVTAEQYVTKALEIFLRVCEADHENIADAWNLLSAIAKVNGNLNGAEEMYIQALNMRIRVLGEGHPNVGNSWLNLGGYYNDVGRVQDAEVALLRGCKVLESAYGEYHLGTARAYNNIGAFYSGNGKHDEAERYYNKALNIRLKMLGENNPETVVSIENLSLLYSKQGAFARAEELLMKASEITLKLYGKISPQYADTLVRIGSLYNQAGKHDEAEKSLKEALALFEKFPQIAAPTIATGNSILGDILRQKGEFQLAEKYLQKALCIRIQCYGHEHPNTAQSYFRLGFLFYSKKNYKQAEEHFLKALTIRKTVYGDQHVFVAEVYQKLAETFAQTGRFHEAEEYATKAVSVYSNLYGDKSIKTANSRRIKGNIFRMCGKLSAAEQEYFSALSACRKLNGAGSKQELFVLMNLAILYKEQGRLDVAEDTYQNALSLAQKYFGTESVNVAVILNNIGSLFHEKEDWQQAKAYYLQALSIYEKLGEGNTKTGHITYGNLGMVYAYLGEFEEADTYCARDLQIVSEQFEERSMQAADASNRYGIVCRLKGDHSKALEAHRVALSIWTERCGDNTVYSAKAHFELGCDYETAGQTSAARESFVKALDLQRSILGEDNPATAKTCRKLELL